MAELTIDVWNQIADDPLLYKLMIVRPAMYEAMLKNNMLTGVSAALLGILQKHTNVQDVGDVGQIKEDARRANDAAIIKRIIEVISPSE